MALTDEERAEINRRNARSSTGPRSPFGKAASSRNAYEHGMRAESFALPNEDVEELKALTDQWLDYYQPESPGRRALLDRAVYATVQLHRSARFQADALDRQVRAAEERWEQEQQEQLDALVATITTDPAAAVRGLRRTAAGC